MSETRLKVLRPAEHEDAASRSTLVPLRMGGWACKTLALDGDDRLRVRFEADGSSDWLEVTAQAGAPGGPVFHRFEHCSVRYRGAIAAKTQERREEVAHLVMAVGESVDALLDRAPGSTLAQALGRTRTSGRIVFGRDALRDLLAPEIAEGVPVAEGFVLADVYPSSYLQHAHTDELELVLDFRRASDARRLLFVVRRRNDTQPAFATTEHFAVTHLSLGAADPPGADAVRAVVAFVLQLHDHDGLDVVFPKVADDLVRALPAAPEPDSPEADPNASLNLAINADCGQSCAFCSIKETAPAEDGGDRVLARVFADLESNRRRGVRTVRINGYDPLAYSRILDVLRRATSLGYEEAHVFSPFTVLADEAFCDAVVSALPARRRFHVPVYSTDPARHDKVVGRRGAHALVMKALENLEARAGADQIWIFLVVTTSNLDQVAGVAEWASRRGYPFHPRMPYPSFESRTDRFFQSAPRMTDVAGEIAVAHERGLRMNVQGVMPCTVFHRMKNVAPVAKWLDLPDEAPALPGTEYRDERFRHRAGETDHAAYEAASVPCPHAANCVMSTICPKEILRSYVEAYGLDEFVPVSLRALVNAT